MLTIPSHPTRRPGLAAALGAFLVAVGLVSGPLATDLTAQAGSRGAELAADPSLAVHHSFPEAGRPLRIVVEGFWPDTAVEVLLRNPTSAPPSVLEALLAPPFSEMASGVGGEFLRFGALADSLGRLSLVIPLDDPADAERSIELLFGDADTSRRVPLVLMVQPPTLLIPGADHIARIDLRDGSVLRPSIPGTGLISAAFSTDGFLGHVLRPGGLLESWSSRDWGGAPFMVTPLDPASDDLAHGRATGPAFVVVRPEASPFAPAGRLVFLDGRVGELLVDPMGDDVSGRRWAVEDDGFTAFVAEDDLLVREVDVLTGTAHGVFSAGLPGDRAIADLSLDGDRLYVLTRRSGGQAGSLTVLDLETGRLNPVPLQVDPLRLQALGDGRMLIVPASESVESANALVVIEDGLPSTVDRLTSAGRILDATPVPGGALVLVDDPPSGVRLELWDPARGLVPFLAAGSVPQATRLVSAGEGVALMLGGTDGLVRRVRVDDRSIQVVEGVEVDGEAPFAVLP